MAVEDIIDIAPAYQRHFRWEPVNQSRFIESVFLGIPIPSLFAATNLDGSWELIDGVQRLNTLIHFVCNEEQLEKFGLPGPLRITGLETLTELNGKNFDDLDKGVQYKLLLRPVKITNLSDKSDHKVRFDLFERLNTGGVILTDQEIRACVFKGHFNDFIEEMSKRDSFNSVVNFPRQRVKDGTPEEFVLKFFAYFCDRDSFQHSVSGFLNEFMRKSEKKFNYKKMESLFERTFDKLSRELPNGIRRGRASTTPVNLYEAITVGAATALNNGHEIEGKSVAEWIEDPELTALTSGGGTNSRTKLNARVDYCVRRFSA